MYELFGTFALSVGAAVSIMFFIFGLSVEKLNSGKLLLNLFFFRNYLKVLLNLKKIPNSTFESTFCSSIKIMYT